MGFAWYYNSESVTYSWRQWSIIELQRRAQDKYENNSAGSSGKYIQLEVPVSRYPKIPVEQGIFDYVPVPKFSDARMSVLCHGAEMRNPNYLTPQHEVDAYRAKQRERWEKKQALKNNKNSQ